MSSFRAFRINRIENNIVAGFEELTVDDLTRGDVVISVKWSGINYKDVLAVTGAGKILRQYPLNGGIDLSGVVMESRDRRYKEGDQVLVAGCGLSETADGGYSEVARVKGDCIVPLPGGLTLREVMALGTAGFTAAMAIARMETNGQTPQDGPIIVTGATGGVGSIAIDILASTGYRVTALTGKPHQHEYLKKLGASDFMDRHTLDKGSRPLETGVWGGAVDNAGGDTLAWVIRTVKPWGNIASIGLVDDYKLNTTVMPFILRGVSLLGINSIEMPAPVRNQLWKRLGADLKPRQLEHVVTNEVAFENLTHTFDNYLNGSNWGRTVVKIQD